MQEYGASITVFILKHSTAGYQVRSDVLFETISANQCSRTRLPAARALTGISVRLSRRLLLVLAGIDM